jgi:hypothetical protein
MPALAGMPGKRVQFDDETLHALNVLARDRMMDFQELADEASRSASSVKSSPSVHQPISSRSDVTASCQAPLRCAQIRYRSYLS